MTIETKFNIGDEAWYMLNNKPVLSFIDQIRVGITKEGVHYSVSVEGIGWNAPEKVFKTKEELIESLFN